jgi:hypothetical protein
MRKRRADVRRRVDDLRASGRRSTEICLLTSKCPQEGAVAGPRRAP